MFNTHAHTHTHTEDRYCTRASRQITEELKQRHVVIAIKALVTSLANKMS